MFSPPRDVGAMLDGSKTATDARFFALALRVGVYCLLWFVTSIAVIYTNKCSRRRPATAASPRAAPCASGTRGTKRGES